MDEDRQILRTVYLSREVDDQLRVAAFRLGKSKNDLMREAIARYLIELGIFEKYMLNKALDE